MAVLEDLVAFNLREEREARGWTQAYAAELAEMAENTLQGYETKRTEPPFEALEKLARIYKVSPTYFFEDPKILDRVAPDPELLGEALTRVARLGDRQLRSLLTMLSSIEKKGQQPKP